MQFRGKKCQGENASFGFLESACAIVIIMEVETELEELDGSFQSL